jgi:hypothetical protein
MPKVNTSTLFAGEDPEKLRLLVARTTDHVRGISEPRTLFYASLVAISQSYSLAKLPGENGTPGKVCVTGQAVPYYPPPPPQTSERGGAVVPSSSWSSKSAVVLPPDLDREVRECKEEAIKLLMRRCDEMVHEVLGGDGGKGVEVWDAVGWKYGELRGADRKDGGDSVRKLENVSIKAKRDSWFSK